MNTRIPMVFVLSLFFAACGGSTPEPTDPNACGEDSCGENPGGSTTLCADGVTEERPVDELVLDLLKTDGVARRGRLTFARGSVETPCFMPVGTYGAVKAMVPAQLREVGAQIILGNTFHLSLRPGTRVIEAHGGLHGFNRWDGPILTDSGGFQVWSLAERRKITEAGVSFASPVDGSKIFLGPEESMAIQRALGSDIVMIFDECTPYPATPDQARASMELSLRWAGRSKRAHEGNPNALFGIVQGGMFEHLRQESLDALVAMDFPGYAIGGVSVGEPKEDMLRIMAHTPHRLPAHKPRYLMGVGTPEDLVDGVAAGVDIVVFLPAGPRLAPCGRACRTWGLYGLSWVGCLTPWGFSFLPTTTAGPTATSSGIYLCWPERPATMSPFTTTPANART